MEEKKLTGYPSIDKPWLKYYTEDAINAPLPESSMYGYIYESNRYSLNNIAINYYGNEITYGNFFDNIKKVAKAFWSHGIRQKDVVTIISLNTPETIYSIYALNMIGATVNLLYANITPNEISEKLKQTDSKYLFVLDKLMDKIGSINTTVPIVLLTIQDSMPLFKKIAVNVISKKQNFESFREFTAGNESVAIKESNSADLPAVIIYTSGSTGEPKGVVLSNKNLNSMVMQNIMSGRNHRPKETFLNIIPCFISFGFGMLHTCHVSGMTDIICLLLEQKSVSKMLKKHRPDRFVLGPAIINLIEEYKGNDLSFLMDLSGGGAAISLEKERAINSLLYKKHAKTKYLAGYGMTELSSAVATNLNDIYKEQSIGIPLPKTNFKVVDIETGEERQYEEEGELLVSSPAIMVGYLNDRVATQNTIETVDNNRWLHTGDIAKIDSDGFTYITGRIKRIYTVIDKDGNVYKLFPQRLEELICTLSFVKKCAVIIVNDKTKLSVPIVFITVQDNTESETAIVSIRKLISDSLASYYYPKEIIIIDEMPITDSQKVDYRALEQEAENKE